MAEAQDFISSLIDQAVGRPIPQDVREDGLLHCKDMGCSQEQSQALVTAVCAELEAGRFDGARQAAQGVLDLTGAYRLISVLLAGVAGKPEGAAAH